MDTVFHAPAIVGFAPYKPRKEAARILDQVSEVLDAYHASLPLTLRQVYYRLVATHAEHPKSDAFYQRLSKLLARARRAGLIDWGAIRDDGVTARTTGGGYRDLYSFRDAMQMRAELYARDKSLDQPKQVIVLCEASGMVPQIADALHGLPAMVRSSGGMDSLTAKYELAILCSRHHTVILHIGDFDPSGLAIFQGINHDVRALADDYCRASDIDLQDFACKRVTIRPEHVEEFGLLTGRIKASDAAKRWYPGVNGDPLATCEAEALPPDELQRMARRAVVAELDLAALEATQALEIRERRLAVETLASLDFPFGEAP